MKAKRGIAITEWTSATFFKLKDWFEDIWNILDKFSDNITYILANCCGFHTTTYLTDSNTVAWWRMDELEDNMYLYDFSRSGYDLANSGFQEGHPCCVFGYGARPYGTDVAYRSLSSSSSLQITGDLTLEGFIRLENLTFSNGNIINVGHDMYNNQYGYVMYLTSTDLVFKVCTSSGVYSCSTPISAFTANHSYGFRGVYDTSRNVIELWTQDMGDITTATGCATLGYPAHRDFSETVGVMVLKDSIGCYGNIQYNTGNYDWVSLAKGWNTNTSAWDYSLDSVVYDNWAVSNVVRTTELYDSINIVPKQDGVMNLGSRFSRFGNVHATHLFGQLGTDVVKDYSVDWGTGTFQVNAADIPIVDSGGLFPSDIVEDALANVKTQANTNETDISTHEADVSNPHDTDFLLLDDTPSSYSGEAGNFPRVNTGETALEFTGSVIEMETANRDIYVDADTGSDSNDGTSWGDAFLTLQKGVDDILAFIDDGVSINVYCRGEFSEGDEEGAVCSVSKVCLGSGKVIVRADDYKGLTAPTSATATTLVFSGTYATDYWKDCYVWIYSGNGAGEARKVTASSSSGGYTTLTVSAWTVTPNTGSRFCLAGRARVTQPVVAGNWQGVVGKGAGTNLRVYGFASHSYNVGEPTPFLSTTYATMSCWWCIGFSNSAGDTADFHSTLFSTMNNVYCASVDSGLIGFQAYRFATINMNRCIITNPASEGVHLEQLCYGYQFRSYFTGGITSVNVIQSALQNRDAYGSDGSSWGILLQQFSSVRQIGSSALSKDGILNAEDSFFLPKRTSASAQPTPETGEIRVWRDPDDNKTYLIYEDVDEGTRKVELT